MPFYGLVYDSKSEVAEIVLEGHDHLIHKPREIYVEDQGGRWVGLEIIDADGIKQIVRLKEALMLAPPRGAETEQARRRPWRSWTIPSQ